MIQGTSMGFQIIALMQIAQAVEISFVATFTKMAQS